MSGMHDDRERLTEALSAYLDGALDGAERETLERHLATCDACRAELAGLRRVGALLRALPEPTLPHSFTLPVTTTRAGRPAAVRRAVGWARAAQWVGGLAATLGAGLLVAGMIPSPSFGTSSTAASYGPGSSSQGGAATAWSTSRPSRTPGISQSTTTRETGTPPPVGTGSIVVQSPTPNAGHVGTENQSAGSPLIPAGATLLVGGGAALAAGTASRRRARRKARVR